jgi:hypothetical protein
MADDVHGSLSTETVSVMARDDKSHSDKDLMSAVHEKTLQELEFVTETDGGKLMETADTSTSSAVNKDGQAEFKAQVFPQQHKGKPLGSLWNFVLLCLWQVFIHIICMRCFVLPQLSSLQSLEIGQMHQVAL